jgi:Flp pilus assembly pilin Flp
MQPLCCLSSCGLVTLVIRKCYPCEVNYTDGPLSRTFAGLILREVNHIAESVSAEMTGFLRELWEPDEAQDVAEYAVMLAVILAIAVATIRLVGSHAGNVFANVGSTIQ